MKFIRMSILDENARNNRPVSEENMPLGAYIDGPVVGHNKKVLNKHEINIPDIVGSDKSSSIVLSSLHSSELSDISYSVYSGDMCQEEQSIYSDCSRSSDQDLERGGDQSS
eukprot:gene27162-30704_t